MSLLTPRLDDRSFEQLLAEARARIQSSCPEWTDLSPGDPGTTLVEVFAHLTEVMLYRLNRIPEKAYVEFLRLLGVQLTPPAAARVELAFRRAGPAARPIPIPRGTRVTLGRSAGGEAPPVFATTEAAMLAPEVDEVRVPAVHGELVEGELAGVSSGLPGQTVRARRAPIVAPLEDGSDLVVTVEAGTEEQGERGPSLSHHGAAFRVWREVSGFGRLGDERDVYVVDRVAGAISFAPATRSTT